MHPTVLIALSCNLFIPLTSPSSRGSSGAALSSLSPTPGAQLTTDMPMLPFPRPGSFSPLASPPDASFSSPLKCSPCFRAARRLALSAASSSDVSASISALTGADTTALQQPTRLLHPWDFLGKSTGVGCHCLLHTNKTMCTPGPRECNSDPHKRLAQTCQGAMEFSRQEYQCGLPFPPPGDLPNSGTEPASLRGAVPGRAWG